MFVVDLPDINSMRSKLQDIGNIGTGRWLLRAR